MKKQAGFTLIELIVVIVILGVLAATALPKFLSIANDARRSVMKGVQGSMAATNAMIYGKAAINGQLGVNGNLTAAQMGTSTAITTRYGYASNVTNLVNAMDINVVNGDFTIAGNDIRHNKAVTVATCAIRYTPAANATTPPVYAEQTAGMPGC